MIVPRVIFGAALACAALACPRAGAQSIWNSVAPTGLLVDAANWQGGAAPADGTAWAFTNSSVTALTNGFVGYTVAGITFTTNATNTANGVGYTIGGSNLTLTGGITNRSTNLQTISAGLTVNSAVNLSNTGNVGIALLTLSGNLSGSGTITYGSVANSGRLTLSGSNTSFTGALIASSGRVNLGNVNAVSASTDYTLNNSGNVYIAVSNSVLSFGSLSGSARIDNNTTGTTNTVVIGGKGISTTFSGNISTNQSGTIHVVKAGAGTLTLSGHNTYIGATTISNGVLQIGTNGTTGSFSNTTAITLAGGVLAFNRSDNITQGVSFLSNGNAISGPGNLTKMGGGTLTLTAANTHSGTTRVDAGKLALSNGLALQNSAFDTGGAGILSLAPTTTALTLGGLIGSGTFAPENYSSVSSLTLNPATGVTCTYFGVLSNGAEGMAMTKSGGGVQIFTGHNTYSGATTVQGGTLVLAATNGAAAGNSGSIAVGSNGVLVVARSEQIPDTATITLSGGEFRLAAGASETAGALTVSAASTIMLDAGSGSTLAFGTYSPTQLLTIRNPGGGNKTTFRSDLRSAVTNTNLFVFPDGYSSSWNAGTTTFTIEEAPPNLAVGTNVTGATPQILGYNMGTFWEGSNTRDWWRYAGVNAARMFLHPNNFPLQGKDNVTTSAEFLAQKAAVQADPLGSANIDWATFADRFANRDVESGGVAQRYKTDHTVGTLRQMGVGMLMQVTASEGFLPITSAGDWGGKWQLWKHYYAMAFHLARQFDVRRYQMFNEPDHPNAAGLLPSNWLMRLQLVKDAVTSAITDVNRLYGKNLVPLVYAPVTASSNVDAAWGGFALANIRTDFLGQTNSAFRSFDRYNYHQYNSSPDSFGGKVSTNRAAVAAALAGSPTLPLAISEWNVHTSAEFELRPTETLDTPAKFSRFGAIAAQLTANQLDEMFVFKFTQTASAGNASGVVKNGMHHADGDNAPYNHGGITQAGEAYRLFNRAAAPGGQLLSFSATGDAANLDLVVIRQPAEGRYYIYSANQEATGRVLAINASGWGLPEGAFATVQEVSATSNGGVIAVDRVKNGRLPARGQPGYSVRLYTIETAPAQTQMIEVAEDTMLADGANKNSNFGSVTTLRTRNDATNADHRHVAALKFSLPLVYGPDILQAVLVMPSASDGTTNAVQAHVYGLTNNAWSSGSTSWSTMPALRQGTAPGKFISNNVIDNSPTGGASIQGQIVTAGGNTTDSRVDVTGFVRERFADGATAASFAAAQDARWDMEIVTQTPGDTQDGGVRIVSREAATDLQPASQLLLVRRIDTDHDGISDTGEQNEFGTSPGSADTDGDSLSDGEEILLHGTNPLLTDTDGDRQNDRAEILLGTNPLDASSVWTARGTGSGPNFTVAWAGAAGLTFRVRRSENLTSWTTIHLVPGTAGLMNFTDIGPLPTRAFYRVEAQ